MANYVITGSASGIGAACRRRLVGEGHSVIGVDLHDAEVIADLGTIDGRAAAVDALHQLAAEGLDGCIAGAGLGPHERPVGRLVAVNYFGALATLDGARDLLAVRSGAAVAICSNSAGIVPVDKPAMLAAMAADDEELASELAGGMHAAIVYAATKLALGRAVRKRAEAWGAAGVRLNAVAPGPVSTPLLQGSIDDPELGPFVDALPVPWGSGRADPDDIASIICFLLSAASAPVHGSVLFADGGTDAILRPDSV